MKAIAVLMSLVLVLAGCAASPASFNKNPYKLSDTQVCKTGRVAGKANDPEFRREVDAEIARRGLSYEQCNRLITQQRVAIGAALLVAAAITAAAASGGGGGAPTNNYGSADYEWDWDMFYEYGLQKTACRGVQTGQFAENWHCAGKPVNDNRWPGPNR